MIRQFREWVSGLKLNIKFTIVILVITAIPIGILAGFLFRNMEIDTIKEHSHYMEYKMDQARNAIGTGLDSINMSTQFFLSDEEMKDVLNRAYLGEKLSTKELIDFQKTDVTNLERLVYNNPLLYAVRVYSVTDNVQEVMPILYNAERMQNLAWSKEARIEGWHFGYYDTAFSSLTTSQDEQIMSCITKIEDHDNGHIGYIEAAVGMETMFSCLYDENESEFSCFVDSNHRLYFGEQQTDEYKQIMRTILDEYEDTQEPVHYRKEAGRHLIITVLSVDEFGGKLIQVEDITDPIHRVYEQRNVFVLSMILALALLTVIINLLVRLMLRQLYIIMNEMRRVSKGEMDTRIIRQTNDEMGELGTQLNMMLDRIQVLNQENIDREILVKNSEIRALQNQINAHFIYNVLESIKMMAEIDEEYEISDAITALGKLLRYSMRWVSGNVSLREELEYIKSYLVLINLRYDFTVFLSLNLHESMMNQELPKMSLQPIVENAVLHGIEPMAEDATIYIKGWYEGEDCVIEITDAGSGMTEDEFIALQKRMDQAVEPTGGTSKSNGIGLKNVHDRIQMAFGKNYGLTFATKLGCYTKVAVRIPKRQALQNSATDREAIIRAAQNSDETREEKQ